MPKLIHSSTWPLRVTDAHGNVWEYQINEVQEREYPYEDYQDKRPIQMTETFILTPNGEKVVIKTK